jgi:uncharacterized protein YdaU (DUF1376 family)
MHSYHHHIKDFNNATRHLTRVERSLYRDAIELYYETEQPLPADDFDRLARRLMAFSDDEKIALRIVLDEFFHLTGDVYTHDRCDEEIDKFHNAKSAKSAAGKASADARRQRAEARKKARKQQDLTPVEQPLDSVQTDTQQNPTNQEPITLNLKPIINPPISPQGESDTTNPKPDKPDPQKKPRARKADPKKLNWDSWPSLPDQQILTDWIAMRKESRATVSQTVINSFGKEMHKATQMGFTVDDCLATCVTRAWRGFKAEWMANQTKPPGGQPHATGNRSATASAEVTRTDLTWAENFDPYDEDLGI